MPGGEIEYLELIPLLDDNFQHDDVDLNDVDRDPKNQDHNEVRHDCHHVHLTVCQLPAKVEPGLLVEELGEAVQVEQLDGGVHREPL